MSTRRGDSRVLPLRAAPGAFDWRHPAARAQELSNRIVRKDTAPGVFAHISRGEPALVFAKGNASKFLKPPTAAWDHDSSNV